jgi:thymidine kinase
LISLADTVLKVKGRCHFCEKESLFSFRTSKEMKQELIGGVEAYVPTCREHYVSLSRNSGKRW